MTDEKNNLVKPLGVFISHCHADKKLARKLARDLTKNGVRVWIDEAEIQVGDSLIERLQDGIEQMDYLAVILSPASVSSEWVRREVEIAMNHEIKGRKVKVLPLLYKPCKLPLFLEGKVYDDCSTKSKYKNSLDSVLMRLGLPKQARNSPEIFNSPENKGLKVDSRIASKPEPKQQMLSSEDRSMLLHVAAEQATAAGVTVNINVNTVNVNYEYSTRRAAEKLQEELLRLGFKCTWDSSMIDGDDEEWSLIGE
jgi:hypothetical protein